MKDAYIQKIESIQGLRDLIQTPLICNMIIEILPQLIDRLSGGFIYKVQKIHIYEIFVKKWYDREM